MSCAEIQHPPVARIHSKTLPIASPIFVPAELEGHICTLKGSPAIVGAENRSVRRARVGVGSAGQVDAARIGRVEGDRLDPHQVHVLVRHPIQHRLPATGRGIPPVRSAHVSPRIAQILHRRMKDHTIHEAATYDLNILPTVLDRTRRLSHGGHCTKQNGAQGGVHFLHPGQPLLRSVKRKKRDCLATGSARSFSLVICVVDNGVKSRAICIFSSSCTTLSQPMMIVLTGCDSTKCIASRMFITPGLVAMADPSHECCCASRDGGVQLARSRPRAGTFMPIMPICFSTASGSSLSVKL